MNAWVLLLRGINVGGTGKLPMADLKAILATLGVRNVATYIQSGNAVFTGLIDASGFEEIVAQEIMVHHGFRPQALVLARETFDAVLAGYPWREAFDDPTSGHIWFLSAAATEPDLDKLAKLAAPSERFDLTARAFYLHAPDGIGRSQLAGSVEKLLGVPTTARNLNTAVKLAAMLRVLEDR